jgi:hypothetical protein
MAGTQEPNWDATLGNMTYNECMRSLCKIGLEIIHHRANARGHQELSRIVQYREKLNELRTQTADHLQDAKMCRSTRDQLEYWNLYLHISYITSELCRPAIKERSHTSELSASLRNVCLESLANTVDAFIGLHNVTAFASQSWAAVHRSLSSALLLAILGVPGHNQRVLKLLHKLVTIMSAINSAVDPSELSAPITRSVDALRKLLPANSTGHNHLSLEARAGMPLSFDGTDVDLYALSDTVTSSPTLLNESDETSPYSIMDNILWGNRRTTSI